MVLFASCASRNLEDASVGDEAASRVAARSVTVHSARRIRAIVLGESARRPAKGVGFRVYFEALGGGDPPARYNVGFFESDHVGYLSVPVPSPNEIVPAAGESSTPPALYLETLK